MMVTSASEFHRGNANLVRQLGKPVAQRSATASKPLPPVEPLHILLIQAKIIPDAVEDDAEDFPAPVGIAAR
jgi:hypothetical protein